MSKQLRSIMGFRPTKEEDVAMEAAELATGRTRSDILRACFQLALKAVVNALAAERDQHLIAFREAAKVVEETPTLPPERPVSYRKSRTKRS
jgi:hypothetical protein